MEEIQIKKLEFHYKNAFEKYNEIKINMFNFFRSIINSSQKYHEISNTLIFVKENISTIQQNQKEEFLEYSEIAKKFSEINKENYSKIAKNIENEFEVNFF
jgi:hypothetical protein